MVTKRADCATIHNNAIVHWTTLRLQAKQWSKGRATSIAVASQETTYDHRHWHHFATHPPITHCSQNPLLTKPTAHKTHKFSHPLTHTNSQIWVYHYWAGAQGVSRDSGSPSRDCQPLVTWYICATVRQCCKIFCYVLLCQWLIFENVMQETEARTTIWRNGSTLLQTRIPLLCLHYIRAGTVITSHFWKGYKGHSGMSSHTNRFVACCSN